MNKTVYVCTCLSTSVTNPYFYYDKLSLHNLRYNEGLLCSLGYVLNAAVRMCHVVVNGKGGFGWLVNIHFFI